MELNLNVDDGPSLCFADDQPGQVSPLPMLIPNHQWACDCTKDVEYHKRARDDATREGNKIKLMLEYHQLGVCYYRLGGKENYKTARKMFEEAYYLALELSREHSKVTCSMNIGFANYCEEKPRRAISEFRTGRAQCEYVEGLLEKKEWPWHLDWVLKVFSPGLDVWVDTAIRLGNAEEALIVEEMRRWRYDMHRLINFYKIIPVQGKKDYPGRTVTSMQLSKIAQSIKASFLVVLRVCRDTLLTWVLSGKTGGVIYHDSQKVEAPEVERWMETVACRKWWPLQEAIVKACEEFKRQREDEEGLSGELCEKYMTDQVRGEIPEDMWEQLRAPEGFSRELKGRGQLVGQILEEYYLKEARGALQRLQEAIWAPIVNKCKGLLEKTANEVVFEEPVSRYVSCALKMFCGLSSTRSSCQEKGRKKYKSTPLLFWCVSVACRFTFCQIMNYRPFLLELLSSKVGF